MSIKYFFPFLFYFVFHLTYFTELSASESKICKALAKGNYKKVERQIKKQICNRKKGTAFDNGPGSGIQITHQYNLDTLTLWLKSQECVAEAAWDKCQIKIAIYPGSSTIGVKLITIKGIVEKCFLIQEGTTGTINIFGWKPHIFKPKNILLYREMSDCPGFVETQRKNCFELKK